MSAPPDKISELLHSWLSCMSDVKAWASAKIHKLIDNRTELMLVTSRRTKQLDTYFNHYLQCSNSLQTVSEEFEIYISLSSCYDAHVSNIAQTCYFRLRRLKFIRRFLSRTATATLVSAFFLSRID